MATIRERISAMLEQPMQEALDFAGVDAGDRAHQQSRRAWPAATGPRYLGFSGTGLDWPSPRGANAITAAESLRRLSSRVVSMVAW